MENILHRSQAIRLINSVLCSVIAVALIAWTSNKVLKGRWQRFPVVLLSLMMLGRVASLLMALIRILQFAGAVSNKSFNVQDAIYQQFLFANEVVTWQISFQYCRSAVFFTNR